MQSVAKISPSMEQRMWNPDRQATGDTAPWRDGYVMEEIENGTYRLEDGTCARQAASCLLRPRRGDRVLSVTCAPNDAYVLAVLERRVEHTAELGVPGAVELALTAPRVAIRASETAHVQSLRDVEITAAGGNVSLTGRNLLTTVSDAVIENMRHYIGRIGSYALQVQSLLRIHGKQALVTAEEDVKVDAERISLG